MKVQHFITEVLLELNADKNFDKAHTLLTKEIEKRLLRSFKRSYELVGNEDWTEVKLGDFKMWLHHFFEG